ncbi:MAG: hypothetical protein ACE5HE_06060 [Phycisphaerae bacterium]
MMKRRAHPRALVLIASIPACSIASAQTEDVSPVVFVTTSTGQGATKGVSGPAFPTARGRFTEQDNGVGIGESVVTLEKARALVTLPDHGISVHLGASSELAVGSWQPGENDVPVTLTLLKGRAYIIRRDTKGWLVVALQGDANSGYALSKGGAMALTADGADVSLAMLEGEAIWYAGAIPDAKLLDDSGEPIDRTGIQIREGLRILPGMLTEPVPEDLARRLAGEMATDLLAFATTQGGQWIADAEKGDFTPVRVAERGTAQFIRARDATELTFDQPRAVVTTPVPRPVAHPVRMATANPARALIESGVPTNVVVGQRVRRTRIIGNPGTAGAQIRVNPNVEQLIRLSGSTP